ncbi:hypothetical protein B0J14DRAFT_90105 [Halenospora varia]|nr:hypothetical protein B0J14DRAFT_90105 [Halenospora varia]
MWLIRWYDLSVQQLGMEYWRRGFTSSYPRGIVLTQGVSYPFNFALPTTTVTAQPSTTFLSDAPGTATSAQSTSMTTVSTSPTTTRTIESPSATSPAAGNAVVSPKASSGGLSVGAKVGIAVGALGVLFLILLAALFFLRRAHKKKRAHNSEQVMLNRSIANDSRDLMAEKEAGHTSPSSFDAPVPVFAGGMGTGERPGSGGRHSALSPYEQIPSQPYSGSAAAVPRRKATASAPSNTQSRGLDSIPASEPLATGGLVSRGVSNASTNIVSPRSPWHPAPAIQAIAPMNSKNTTMYPSTGTHDTFLKFSMGGCKRRS